MILHGLPLQNSFLVDTQPHKDNRGVFARFFCEKELKMILGNRRIVNVNYSKTLFKGSIRGLHFQYPDKAEMKFVRCIEGKVYDVFVDIRKDSSTFLMWHAEELSEDNMKMLIIPEGFAHGFQTLTDNCRMIYLHTEYYSPDHESGLNPLDPMINIKWPLEIKEISTRDRKFPYISCIKFEGIKL